MPRFPAFELCFLLLLLLAATGCLPSRGTMPARTFCPDRACADEAPPEGGAPRWSKGSLEALRDRLARREPAIVRYLAGRAELLRGCTAPARYLRAGDRLELDAPTILAHTLDGECDEATHVVREAPLALASAPDPRIMPTAVELAALSLGDHDLTGTWRGVMRQPHGPYQAYDMALRVEHRGERVAGVTELRTLDGVYWGRMRFEGRLEGNILYFADAHLIDENLGPFLSWCMKGGYLIVDPRRDRLAGPWRAFMCAPGTLHLERERRGE